MAEPISFYFDLFKKFQVIGHVNGEVDHGAQPPNPPAGGFSLLDPASIKPFSPSPNTNLNNNTIYQLLSTGVMPLGATQFYPPGWDEFQTGGNGPPPSPTLVEDLATWIQANSTYDIPANVIALIPANPPGALAAGVVSPYVFSMPNDTGVRPDAVPNDFWDTSLIFLVDPNSGNTVSPGTLIGEYWLCAVIGNNGSLDGGQYLSGANPATYVQAQAYIMVFNTVMGPGVQLPSLSNLDPNDTTDVTYDQYFLWSGSGNDTQGNPVFLNSAGTSPNPKGTPGCYDVVGFRFNVKNTFNNLVTAVQSAINANQLILPPGVTTAQQFVLGTPQSPAHACAKVLIGQGPGGATFPSLNASPLTTATIAQKNLAPFDVLVSQAKAMKCVHFVIGQPEFIPVPGAGANILTLETKLPRDRFRLYLSFRKEAFRRCFGEAPGDKIKGFRQITHREIAGGQTADLASDAVVLQLEGGNNRIEIPPIPQGHFYGATLCVEYDSTRLEPGNLGEINLVHRAMLPKLTPGTRCFEIEETIAGGFTLQVRAIDPFRGPKGKRK